MKILLSAYACEPDKGSEPGVGWNWALALARRGYEVHVLTRTNNRDAIESARGKPESLQFHFFDYPTWTRFWKKWPGGIYLYYLLWQIGAYRAAAKLHARERFDLVQHITFVSFRQPSFMGRLGIPFIFGPVGGGETMPSQLRSGLLFSGRFAELLRNAGNRLVAFDPLMSRTYADAQVIACATEETLLAVPVRVRSKCIVQRAIGTEEDVTSSGHRAEASSESGPRFLFVGRLLYWKGLHLVLRALSRVKEEFPKIRLRIIGDGPDRAWLHEIAERAGVTDFVEWVARIAHSQMQNEYRGSVGFVFPSLHDSGGMVVLEALAAGLPVICLDLGGPGSMVDSSCGIVVKTGAESEKEIINRLAEAMIRLLREPELRAGYSVAARQRAGELSWDAAAEGVYGSPGLAESLKDEIRIY